MQKNISLVIGSSGLVGSYILKNLEETDEKVIILSRKPNLKKDYSTEEIITDFTNLNILPSADTLYVAIGYKLSIFDLMFIPYKKRQEFMKVDFSTVLKVARLAFANGTKQILVVSAVGANPNSMNLYLKTKGELEEEIKKIGYESITFARPSHLLGKRLNQPNAKLIEFIEFFSKLVQPLMISGLKKFRNIEAKKVAATMVKSSKNLNCIQILEYKDFVKN